MQNINGWRALPLPFIPDKAGAQPAIASQLSPAQRLDGLTLHPHQVPELPAIARTHMLSSLPPSGEGRQGGLPEREKKYK